MKGNITLANKEKKVAPRIPDNARVKLRDGIGPEFYEGFGLPGNEGWIRKHESDRYGPERVYVEWDRNHWAYNGVQNGWTWEDHFDIVEESMSEQPNKEEQIKNLMGAFTEALVGIVSDDAPAKDGEAQIPSAPVVGQKASEEEPSYEEILKAAINSTIDAEAFFLIAIRKNEDEGIIYPVVYHGAHTPADSLIAQLQLSHIASSYHAKAITEMLKEHTEEDKS